MEIDITRFVETAIPCEFSASQMELGKDAGKITWNNAKREAAEQPILTVEALDAFRAWTKEFGAWDDEEITAWDIRYYGASATSPWDCGVPVILLRGRRSAPTEGGVT